MDIMFSNILRDAVNYPENADLSDVLKNALNVKHKDPNGPCYQNLRKLYAKCLLWSNSDSEAAFNLTESVASSLRTMAVYRYEQHDVDDISKIRQSSPCTDEKIDISTIGKLSDSARLNNFLLKYSNYDVGKIKHTKNKELPKPALDRSCLIFTNSDDKNLEMMIQRLKDMPKEWTIVQLTSAYNPSEPWQSRKNLNTSVSKFHLTVLKSCYVDCEEVDPITVTLSQRNCKDDIKSLFFELHSLLEENVQVLSTNLASEENYDSYWDKRRDGDIRIKNVIESMENDWLGGWKCLLLGMIQDDFTKHTIEQLVNDACKENKISGLSKKQVCLLYSLMTSTHHLTSAEIRATLKQIFIEFIDIDLSRDSKAIKDVIAYTKCDHCSSRLGSSYFRLCLDCRQSYFERIVLRNRKKVQLYDCIKVFSMLAIEIKNHSKLTSLKRITRGPVILIIDEYLDTFPWESLPVLKEQPVTRMESFHFLCGLYQKHKDNIVDGYYLLKPTDCRFLINPSNDLERMSKRMSAFISYWCPSWSGQSNKPPSADSCLDYIGKSNLFLYCGHGDGCKFISNSLSEIEGASQITNTALLYGCSSVRLVAPGGRSSAVAAHHCYHIAGCPSVVGMLWEVTDLEVDKIASMLISMFVPSKVKPHWGNVKKANWTEGKLDTNVEDKFKFDTEPDLLHAISKSRKFTKFVMIASSIVARGIPVKIHPDYQIP